MRHAGPRASGLALQRGRGDGTFDRPGNRFPGLVMASMMAVDIDGDHRPDVVGCDDHGQVATLRNSPQGLGAVARIPTGAAPGFCSVVPVDLDRDGHVDLVSARERNQALELLVLRNSGDGNFAPPIGFPSGVHADAGAVMLVAVADFDGDHLPDAALAEFGTYRVAVLRGRGDGTFAPASTSDLAWPIAVLAAGDLDGDGLADLVLNQSDPSDTSQLVVYLNTGR